MNKRYSRVILLGVDGAGIFFAQADTPNMDKLFENGAVTYKALTSLPTISAECWGSMLHGVGPEVHKLTNSIVGSTRYDTNSPYPSFFRVIRENYPDAKLVSFCNWDPINYGIIEENLGVHQGTAGDEHLTDKIVSYINENDFDTMFIQYDDVDGAGHNFGYGFKEHLERITITDSYIGRIVEALKARDMFDDTLFIVTADHGGTPTGGHGGSTDAEKIIYMGIAGKGVMKGEISPECPPNVKDLAAIVLYGMGLDIPETWTAKIPSNIFSELCDGTSANAVEADAEPVADSGEEFTLRTQFTFDGAVKDVTGGTDPLVIGNANYEGGTFDLSTAHIIMDKYKIGVDNFKIVAHLMVGGQVVDGVLITNKRRDSDEAYGFAIKKDADVWTLNIGDGTKAYNYSYKQGGAIGPLRVVVTINRKTAKASISVYEQVREFDISEIDKNCTLDALALTIGAYAGSDPGLHISAKIRKLEIYR